MSYLQSLNEVQRQAVTHINGPVMVIAGPGSGKTRVLTYHIAYLIEQGIAPQHIPWCGRFQYTGTDLYQ